MNIDSSRPESPTTPLTSPDPIAPDTSSAAVADDVIRLLEERLVVDRTKRKVGEVIVRKAVETEIVEVPVRRERLIVEQVSPEYRQLASIDLGQGEVAGVEMADAAIAAVPAAHSRTVTGTFADLDQAIAVLNQLSPNLQGQHEQVSIQITLRDAEMRDAYQAWFDRQGSRA